MQHQEQREPRGLRAGGSGGGKVTPQAREGGAKTAGWPSLQLPADLFLSFLYQAALPKGFQEDPSTVCTVASVG